MGFFLQGWGKVDTSCNDKLVQIQEVKTLVIYGPPPVYHTVTPAYVAGSFQTFNYYADVVATGSDTQGDIGTDGYFDLVRNDLQVGDIIFAYSADDVSTVTYVVAAINAQSPYVVTEAFNLGAGEVVTADFANSAVTYAKIQDVTAQRLLGNPTGAPVAPEEISLGNGLLFTDPFLIIPTDLTIHASGTISAAEWNDMYNTPVQIADAPAPGSMIAVDRVTLRQIYGGAQYTGGGTVVIGYDDVPTGLGEQATANSISAATITNIAATSALSRVGFTSTPIFVANAIGVGIWISNQTAVFATGNGNWEYNIWYRIIGV